jgi:prepilin-type N-terminal cleavage/methylation domain-containing protein
MKRTNGSGPGFTPLRAGFIPLRAGFTLIEMLVVITIIGLLAAIIVPSIAGAMKGAKKARAMSQIRDLDGAIKRFFAEYNKMPVPVVNGVSANGGPDNPGPYADAEQAAVIKILIGVDTNANPRQIVFLDLDPASFGVKTVADMLTQLTGGTPYKDPWGNAYGIMMDLNFDEKITGGSYGEIRSKVAVYSGGEHTNTVTPPYKTW